MNSLLCLGHWSNYQKHTDEHGTLGLKEFKGWSLETDMILYKLKTTQIIVIVYKLALGVQENHLTL